METQMRFGGKGVRRAISNVRDQPRGGYRGAPSPSSAIVRERRSTVKGTGIGALLGCPTQYLSCHYENGPNIRRASFSN